MYLTVLISRGSLFSIYLALYIGAERLGGTTEIGSLKGLWIRDPLQTIVFVYLYALKN